MLPLLNTTYQRKDQKEGRKGLFYLEENVYPIEDYVRKLNAVGFKEVCYQDISPHVFKGIIQYYLARLVHPKSAIQDVYVRFNHKKWQWYYAKLFEKMYGTRGYYLIKAVK